MRTIFILSMCCATAAAAGPHHIRQDKEQRSEPPPLTEVAPWDSRLSKDPGKGKYAGVKWSCVRSCDEVKGDESWLMTLEMPARSWSGDAPYGANSKAGLPLERAEFRREEERKHLGLYNWLVRRGDRANSKQFVRAAVVIKWQNGMELEMYGTKKDGFDHHICVWREKSAVTTTPEATVE